MAAAPQQSWAKGLATLGGGLLLISVVMSIGTAIIQHVWPPPPARVEHVYRYADCECPPPDAIKSGPVEVKGGDR